jgi:CRP/FNR family transcriptional regulator, anaerobic regulatory protein
MLAMGTTGGRDAVDRGERAAGASPVKGLGGMLANTSGIDVSPVRIVEAKEHIFVEAGNIAIYHMLSDGRRQVLDFAYPGDIIGLGAIREHNASAQATCRARIHCIPAGALLEAASRNPAISRRFMEALARELQAARELLFTVSQRSATERVASFLLALSRRNSERGENPDEVVLPMTRTDIADFLGLTIETVSRTLTRFRMLRVIGIEQCILITIRDAAALADLAAGGEA